MSILAFVFLILGGGNIFLRSSESFWLCLVFEVVPLFLIANADRSVDEHLCTWCVE